jgi:hypothetical protein
VYYNANAVGGRQLQRQCARFCVSAEMKNRPITECAHVLKHDLERYLNMSDGDWIQIYSSDKRNRRPTMSSPSPKIYTASTAGR